MHKNKWESLIANHQSGFQPSNVTVVHANASRDWRRKPSRSTVNTGSSLKPYCLNLSKKMNSFYILHLALVGKRDTKLFQHVGTKVLAITISHAGTSPGSEAAHLSPLLAASVREELGYCWHVTEGKGLISGFHLVLYNTQVQVFVPKTDRERQIHKKPQANLSNLLTFNIFNNYFTSKTLDDWIQKLD